MIALKRTPAPRPTTRYHSLSSGNVPNLLSNIFPTHLRPASRMSRPLLGLGCLTISRIALGQFKYLP